MNNSDILLDIQGLSVDFPITGESLFRKQTLSAVNHVSLKIGKGKTLGLVGESGCGKSTLADTTLGFVRPTDGKILFKGQDLASLKGKEYKKARQLMSKVFQDPLTSINPRFKIIDVLREPLLFQGGFDDKDIEERAKELIKEVGLNEEDLARYPREFSGGQQQRIAIARALMLRPEYLVLDEPTSSLDVSVHAQIISLLEHFKKKWNISYLMISHNLSLVKTISDDVAVMYLGRIVEYGAKDEIFNNAKHPYTKALLSSVLNVNEGKDKEPSILKGSIPSPINPPKYCRFYSRCPLRKDCCKTFNPILKDIGENHQLACDLLSTDKLEG